MALKFLNKKGWHTGSLRNIEKVWKAEQKQEAEEKKLEEIRLQIQLEKERSEFYAIMEQAGLVDSRRRTERLEFLYDPGLAVAVARENANSAIQNQNQNQNQRSNNKKKKHFANDSWRKSHSDPLLLIRQQEHEARKSMKEKRKDKDGETTMEHKRKHLRRV